MEKIRKNIVKLLVCFVVMFGVLIVYIVNFQLTNGKNVVLSSYNRRLTGLAEVRVLGDIFDRNGDLLATATEDGQSFPRFYKGGSSGNPRAFSHVVGYNDLNRGRSGAEQYYAYHLLGMDSNLISNIIQEYRYGKIKGNDVHLTIDSRLQVKAERALASMLKSLNTNRAALVVMNAQTGEILSMVSKPDYNPNDISEDVLDDKDKPLLNRAIQGRYAPGSTFKIVTAASALMKDEALLTKTYHCDGMINIGKDTLSCLNNKAHGDIDMNRAMEVSCNTTFTKLGQDAGYQSIKQTAGLFGFNKKVHVDQMPISQSTFKDKTEKSEMARTWQYIGQGDISVTPLHVAMITSAVVNDGKIMAPVMIEKVKNYRGVPLHVAKPSVLYNPITPKVSQQIKDMLINVVKNGSGKNFMINGIETGGKTGTAQVKDAPSHTWFTGFANGKNGYIVVTVVIENGGGTGGGQAAPVARDVAMEAIRLGY
ncbi:MAG: penicillin-binding protein 2 [Clostridia bacterium]|nr:penicillin-binding protein 2 [Clostridia bacterium]